MSTTNEVPMLSVEGLKVFFQSKTKTHDSLPSPTVGGLGGINLSIPENTTLALVGESGSGKSLTALSIVNLLPENALRQGRIVFDGQDLMKISERSMQHIRGLRIACVFQDPMSSLNPVLRIGVQLCEPLMQHQGLSLRQAMRLAENLLEDVQLGEPKLYLQRYPHQLSGGQQQRVMIAMAMACRPKLLIADEPTTALDVTVQQQILSLLRRLKTEHRMSMLFISHDLGVVDQVADHVVVMRHGQVCESGPAMQVLHAPAQAYTSALLACRVSLLEATARLQTIDTLAQATWDPTAKASPTDQNKENKEPFILEAHSLKQHYWVRRALLGRSRFLALGGDLHDQGVSFQLQHGHTLGVVGESGSGKSTLGLTLLRLQHRGAPTHLGQVIFNGRDIATLRARELKAWRRKVQVVFQNPYASLNPRLTIRQALQEPMLIHRFGGDHNEREACMTHWLEKVGLESSALSKYPHEFSGGQRQRIAIARCLILQPELLILDEAVSALDISVQAQVLNLLKDLQDELGMAYVFISHDLSVVRFMANDVIVMHAGRVVEQGPTSQIWQQPSHPYTQQLLAAIPSLGAAPLGLKPSGNSH